jgi:hypothetical protein
MSETKIWTRKEIDEIAKRVADQSIKDLEEGRNSPSGIGCQSQLGCIAGKKHDAYHKFKLDSDINNLLEFRDSQLKENQNIAKNLSEAAANINIASFELRSISEKQKEIKDEIKENEGHDEREWSKRDKRLHWYDVRQWGIFSAIVLMCLGTIWATNRVNSVDRDNQINTESLMIYLAAKVSGEPLDDIKKEVEQLILKERPPKTLKIKQFNIKSKK